MVKMFRRLEILERKLNAARRNYYLDKKERFAHKLEIMMIRVEKRECKEIIRGMVIAEEEGWKGGRAPTSTPREKGLPPPFDPPAIGIVNTLQ